MLFFSAITASSQTVAEPAGEKTHLFRFVSGGNVDTDVVFVPDTAAVTGSMAPTDVPLLSFGAEDRFLYTITAYGDYLNRLPLRRKPTNPIGASGYGFRLIGSAPRTSREDPRVLVLDRGAREVFSVDGSTSAHLFADGSLLAATNEGVECYTHLGRLLWSISGRDLRVVDGTAGHALVVGPDGGFVVDGEGQSRRAELPDAVFGAFLDGRGLGVLPPASDSDRESAARGDYGPGFALATRDGRILFADSDGNQGRFSLGVGVLEMAAGADGGLLVVATDGKLRVVDADGSVRFAAGPADGAVVSVAAASDGGAFIGTDTGLIAAVTDTGALRWSYNTWRGAPVAQVSVPIPGLLTVSDGNWVLYGIEDTKAAGPPPAEEPAPPSFPPVADPEWTDNLNYLYLSRLAEGRFVEDKESVLEEIAEAVDSSALRRRLYSFRHLLRLLIVEPLVEPQVNSGALLNNHPSLRLAAIERLVTIAAPSEALFLLEVADNEFDPQVIAALFRGIGRIGADPAGYVRRRITDLVQRELSRGPRAVVIEAAIEAHNSLQRFSGGDVSTRWTDLLLELLSADVPRRLRQAILAALRG